MKLRFWRYALELAHPWAIARELKNGQGGTEHAEVVFVELTDHTGLVGFGEAAPSDRYDETADSVIAFLERVSAYHLAFDDLEGSFRYLASVSPGNFCAKGAVNVALLDGAARMAGKSLHDFLGLPFFEGRYVSSFSIGIAKPEVIERKVQEAAAYPILKLKLGGPDDRASLRALRAVAPHKPLRLDANEAWTTKEEALRNLEWLAEDGNVQFVEQPMPATASAADEVWLKNRAPLPIMADESYVYAGDVSRCAEGFHAVNVKLVKCGGVTAGLQALRAARAAGLKTMLGCMIESSVLISAAAHLAELADYLDLDGSLLVTNDPFRGVTCHAGRVSFAQAPLATGLQVAPR